MPIPSAHPLAALAFRRWCPRRLNLAGLVIGSVTPDLANCLNWDHFTHSPLGSLAFSLPVGAALLWTFFRVRAPLAATLPSPHREALLPLCETPVPARFICGLSLLLGCWTHVVWDLFTHDHSSFAERLGYWDFSLSDGGASHLRVSRVLWLVSSVGGTTCLVAAYAFWLRRFRQPAAALSRSVWRACRTWLGWVLVPMLVAIPLGLLVTRNEGGPAWVIRAMVESYVTLQCFTLVIAGFVFKRQAGLRA